MSGPELFAILRPEREPGPFTDGVIAGWTWEVWAHMSVDDWSESKMLDHGGPVPSGNAGADAAKVIGSYSRLLAFVASAGSSTGSETP